MLCVPLWVSSQALFTTTALPWNPYRPTIQTETIIARRPVDIPRKLLLMVGDVRAEAPRSNQTEQWTFSETWKTNQWLS